jgi:hypothetical protein
MKTIFALAILTLMSGSANAWDINTTCTNSKFYGRTCKTSVIADQPRDLALEAADEAAKQQRIRKWESFCKPARTYDSEGVIRLVYAREGCEFGRSE